MATLKLLGLEKLFLIVTVISSCSGLQVSIEQELYQVAKGEDVVFTCSFVPARPITDNIVLKWEMAPDEPGDPMKIVASYFLNKPVNIAPAFEDRASMVVDIPRQVSTLRLTKVTMQDSRVFQCSVSIFDDDEGKLAATTSLLVLEPPSEPICRIKGSTEYWHNISITCMSEEGSPLPSYKWQSYSVENIPRQFPPKTTEKDGALSLFNLTKEMSGFYICTSTNQVGTAKCNLTLAVMPGSMNMGSTAIIIGVVVAGVVLLGVVIFCCCRKKGKDEEEVEGPQEELEFHDKDSPQAKQYLDDDSNSKTKQEYKDEDKDVVPQSNYSVGKAGQRLEDDQQSYNSGRGRHDGKGSDVDSRRYQDDQHRGSRADLYDRRDHYGGSRDRLDDRRDRYGGSRDRLDDQRERYGGSRDRLDDRGERYGGSRDRLDDRRDRYGGSRDRLDDQRDRYGGSRDRLDDRRDHYGGSRDRLEYADADD